MRVGVDIGGTFTDFAVVEESGEVQIWKEDTTPHQLELAVKKGVEALSEQRRLSLNEFLGRCETFVHGSTVATNTVVARTGGPIGLVCTAGFRDVLLFRDGYKAERFNVHRPRPHDFVDRYLRLGVRERIDRDGEIVVPLRIDDVRRCAERLREAGVNGVAVALLWSVVNPVHEIAAAEVLREELPGVPVVCSHEILDEMREWQRTSATVLSAYVRPSIEDYLTRLERYLTDNGLARPPQYMQINGGCASLIEILKRPVMMLGSGPAAAPAAALHQLQHMRQDDSPEEGNAIIIDMGGTTLDLCVIREGRPFTSRSLMAADQPIGVAGVEIRSIGAGGGSIAWIDSGGAMRVGPQSAGAVPGPVCYGAGGEKPTVTDANLALGYLSPAGLLGGRRALDIRAARAAIAREIGDPLGMKVEEAAAGVIEIVNTNMVGAMRGVSVERGVDPRGYTLVSAGGAGGLHAVDLARSLGIRRVSISAQAPAFCAFGMTVTDVRHDYGAAMYARSDAVDLDELNARLSALESRARDRLREEGFDDDRIEILRTVDARYRDQVHELPIDLPAETEVDEAEIGRLTDRFHDAHETRYTYAVRDEIVEFLQWRVSAIGRRAKDAASGQSPGEALPNEAPSRGAPIATIREAWFPELSGMVETPVYRADQLEPGRVIVGNAIVESAMTTVLLRSGDELRVLPGGDMIVEPNLDLAHS